jgi:DAK2 domain fusion protein YloV
MLACLRGEASPDAAAAVGGIEDGSVFEKFDTADITFAYDTVFIVRRKDQKPLDLLRAYLDSIGDSLVIGEDDECFKVHVHTNIPGDALTEAQKYGTLETAKIENMRTQHDELVEDKAPEGQTLAAPEKEYGAVAVCAGDGMADLFREVGADTIVTGGQTMNPSTDDILREINRTPARTVFVFPNNKNIIMAAEQCVPLTDKEVVVIPTKSIPQGISALLCLEPEESEENIIEAMSEAIDKVHTALVTYAARDSEFDGHDIQAGEYLALLDGGLVGSFTSVEDMLSKLCTSFEAYSPEIITVYYGEDVDEDAAQKVADDISAHFGEAEVSVVSGGQPVYYYMISVE